MSWNYRARDWSIVALTVAAAALVALTGLFVLAFNLLTGL